MSCPWNAICRLHIIHAIHCLLRKGQHPVHLDAPHLSEYVRKIKLYSQQFKTRSPALEWLPECFGRLKNLSVLSLEPPRRFPFNSMAPAPKLAAGISSMLSAPYLRKLVLHGWSFSNSTSNLLSMIPATLEELIIEDFHDRCNVPSWIPDALSERTLRGAVL